MNIEILFLDIDGVLTDGCVTIDSKGNESYTFNKQDSKGIELLKKSGVHVIAITSEQYRLNIHERLKKLDVDYVSGIQDKRAFVENVFLFDKTFTERNFAFIGDDIQDKPLLEKVGLPFCPKNAVDEIKNIPGILICSKEGGKGAIREVTDFILDHNKIFPEPPYSCYTVLFNP